MPKLFWTPDKIDFIANNLHVSDKEIAKLLNVTRAALKCIRLKHKILRTTYRYWTDKDDIILKKVYPNIKTKTLVKKLGRSARSIYQRARILGLKKSKEFLASPESGIFIKGSTIGHQHRFQKGNVPANKGKKMSPELKKKVEYTFFQKGHKPNNTLYDGAITIRHDKTPKSKRAYKYIRLAEGYWVELHRYNWEAKHGKIPKGFNVVFKNGDSMNCDLSNLELISHAELMKRNTLIQWPPDLQKTIKLNNKLKKQIDGRY